MFFDVRDPPLALTVLSMNPEMIWVIKFILFTRYKSSQNCCNVSEKWRKKKHGTPQCFQSIPKIDENQLKIHVHHLKHLKNKKHPPKYLKKHMTVRNRKKKTAEFPAVEHSHKVQVLLESPTWLAPDSSRDTIGLSRDPQSQDQNSPTWLLGHHLVNACQAQSTGYHFRMAIWRYFLN